MALQRQITVSTSPVQVYAEGEMRVLVQNLGAGDVYIGMDDQVTTANGVKIPSGGAFETPAQLVDTEGHLWLVSDASADVRIMRVG